MLEPSDINNLRALGVDQRLRTLDRIIIDSSKYKSTARDYLYTIDVGRFEDEFRSTNAVIRQGELTVNEFNTFTTGYRAGDLYRISDSGDLNGTVSVSGGDTVIFKNDVPEGVLPTTADYDVYYTSSSGGGGGVTSVFGRSGVVVSAIGDYSADQITNAFDKTVDTTTSVPEGSNLYYTEGRVSANVDVAANTLARHNAVTVTDDSVALSGQAINVNIDTVTGSGNNLLTLTAGQGLYVAPQTGVTNLSAININASTLDIASDTGTDVTVPASTGALAGLMTAAQYTKLDGIALNANNYVHPNHTGDVTSIADGVTTISNNVVTNAKLADVAANTLKGNGTAAFGDPSDIGVSERQFVGRLAGGNVMGLTVAQTWQNLDYQYIESTTEVSTGGPAVIYLTMTTPALQAGTYVIEMNGIMRNSAANGDWAFDITEGAGVAGTNTSLLLTQIIEEGIDAGGNQRYSRNITRDVVFTAGVKNINIELGQIDGGTMTMYFGALRLYRVA